MATRQRGDASAFAAFFTEDGIYMVPGLPDASGQSAIRALAQERFAAGAGAEIVDPQVVVGGDTGEPIVILQPDSPAAHAFAPSPQKW